MRSVDRTDIGQKISYRTALAEQALGLSTYLPHHMSFGPAITPPSRRASEEQLAYEDIVWIFPRKKVTHRNPRFSSKDRNQPFGMEVEVFDSSGLASIRGLTTNPPNF